MIYFKMHEEPVAKGRPRFTRRGHAYTPRTTREYEDKVLNAFLSQNRGDSKYPKDVPLMVEAVFAKSIPKSYSKRKHKACLDGEMLPTQKPDIDNYLKAVLDAINGYAFEDDSQIVTTQAEKIYAEEPYVSITIRATDETRGFDR